jgi:hypothetical protein
MSSSGSGNKVCGVLLVSCHSSLMSQHACTRQPDDDVCVHVSVWQSNTACPHLQSSFEDVDWRAHLYLGIRAVSVAINLKIQ